MYIACRTAATKIKLTPKRYSNTTPPPNGTAAYTTNALQITGIHAPGEHIKNQIGWDGADKLINRKIVEVLAFTKRGIPVFEKKMFKANRVISSRLIFEYADRATMLLRYNEKHKMIIIDHLSPAEDRFKDMYQYYGPEMSYDALEFKGGRWLLESNIDPEIAINYQKNPIVNRIKRHGASHDF